MIIWAHYDGKVFVPEEPVNLPVGTEVLLTILVPDQVPETATEIDDFLRKNPDLQDMWATIAAGRDNVTVAKELRSHAKRP